MPNVYPDIETEVVSSTSTTASMTEYITVGKALKLVTPFKCDKRDFGIYCKCQHGI